MSELAARLKSEAEQLEAAGTSAMAAALRGAFDDGVAQFAAVRQAA